MNKKTIWITGGSTGIGKALAIKFANKGWNVAISARRENLLKEISDNDRAILFIDEIHTVVGAGATSGGSMDASNLLKPALASGQLRCIGSTTYKEYRSHFEKDRALVRRFQKIDVSEPSNKDAVKILNGLNAKDVMLRTSIDVDGVIISSNDYLFEKTKFLKIDEQNFNVNVEKVDSVYNIDIESKSFLNRFYALCLNDSGVFSDNYFNMLPGEKRKIQFTPSEKFKGSSKFDPRLEFNSVLGLCS